MPKKGEPCEMCNKPEPRGVPGPVGSCCEMRFQACINDWKAKQAVASGCVPF